MRTTPAPFLFALCITHAAAAAATPEPARPYGTHIRPLTPTAVNLVRRAVEQSAIVRAQLEDLEKTDIVVYVTDSVSTTDVQSRTHLEFMGCAAGTRYLVMRIDRWRMSPWEAIAQFGHEIHHALEIAGAPEVRTSTQMARLYQKIGWVSGPRQYESDGAKAAGERVRNELAGFSQ